MLDTREELNLLLVTVAQERLVRRGGIHFQGVRYMESTLAAYVGESVTIRYRPRDLAEIRIFHRGRFLCRAISSEHSSQAITLKDIQRARTDRRRFLRRQINERIAKSELATMLCAVIDRLACKILMVKQRPMPPPQR